MGRAVEGTAGLATAGDETVQLPAGGMVLQTTSKWLVLLQLPHILPYAGQCLQGCPVLQYLDISIIFSYPTLHFHVVYLSGLTVKFLHISYTVQHFFLHSLSPH